MDADQKAMAMEELTEADRVTHYNELVARGLSDYGGFLRCEQCGGIETMTAKRSERYTLLGWPRCCNYQTMRWWTQRQIDAGQVPRIR